MFEILARKVRQKIELKGIQTEEEVKVSRFADALITVILKISLESSES